MEIFSFVRKFYESVMTTKHFTSTQTFAAYLHAAVVVTILSFKLALCAAADVSSKIRFVYPGSADGWWGNLAQESFSNTFIQPLPARQFGGRRYVLAALRGEHAEIVMISGDHLASIIPEFNVLTIPFLFANTSTASAAISEMHNRLADVAKKKGVEVLDYLWTRRTFVSQTTCVVGPRELRGRNVVGGHAQHQTIFRLAGGRPVPPTYIAASHGDFGEAALYSTSYMFTRRFWESHRCLTGVTEVSPFLDAHAIVVLRSARHLIRGGIRKELAEFVDAVRTKEDEDNQMLVTNFKSDGKEVVPMTLMSLWRWRTVAFPLYAEVASDITTVREIVHEWHDVR